MQEAGYTKLAPADTSDATTRGGTFGFGHHLSDLFSIGLKVGLHSFSETFEKDVYID